MGGAKEGERDAAYFQSEASALLMLSFTYNIFVLQGGNAEITWGEMKERGVSVATTFLIILSSSCTFL